jgi:competence protein ComEC
VAVRAADGVLYLSADNARSYVADVWFKREGATGFRTWPWRGASPDGRLRCDALGCIYRIGSTKVALLRQADALAEDCGAARLVVAPALTRTGCPGAAIDRRSLMTRGAHIAWVDATGIRILDDRTVRGERPWVTYPWRDRPPWKGHTAKRFR